MRPLESTVTPSATPSYPAPRPHGGPSLLDALLATLALLVFLLPVPARAAVVFDGPVTEINGLASTWVGFPLNPAAISVRPQSAAETSITFENYWIHDLTNQKALEVKVTTLANGLPAWAYESITLRNIKITNVTRDQSIAGAAGLHIDHIRISGQAVQNHPMNLLLENIEIDGGDALPLLIADGVYGTITLRNVSIKNTTNNVQIKTDKVGSVNKLIIEDSPGLGVALIGRPGSIGEVLVRDSLGARVGDTLSAAGRSGATISYVEAAGGLGSTDCSGTVGGAVGAPIVGAPVPEPGTVGVLIALTLPALLRRPRSR